MDVFDRVDPGADTWPFDQPCYLILNMAIGGAWGGQKGIDQTIFPQRFEIDYVRVYQQCQIEADLAIGQALWCLLVVLVGLFQPFHRGRAAMNPDAVTAADGFSGLERLRLHAGPAQAKRAVVPGQPFEWEIRMIWRDQDGGPAGLLASGEAP